ncbi:MbtH family NRPS accessory protein [Actinopolyspora biskrensis]|uniref:MbtH family NRPS accessory protein n=1 Tax=Actinopolyspora biskrensis TaxID=1470178 RepID=UPI003CCDA0CA
MVVNNRGQHSIWRCDRRVPPGWMSASFDGTREECLDYIDRSWADMRSPRSA